MTEPIEFETERLVLRRWRESDLTPFAAMNGDHRVMEHFPKPLERLESDELAHKIRAHIEEHGWGLWAVEVKAIAPFIGFVGLNVPNAALPFSPCVEIGWRLAFEHWRRGYASEAARAVLGIAFETLDLAELVSFTAVGNQRSRRVMERIGMHFSCEFEHPALPENCPLRAHVLYRLWRPTGARRPR
ncbi:MAG TPA: GNAT family N-acetyltransferase [Gammaproteobacteria bacterium]|nr:GNAT family N-acetyltransferase [Gammaproteobacteria bacterium]